MAIFLLLFNLKALLYFVKKRAMKPPVKFHWLWPGNVRDVFFKEYSKSAILLLLILFNLDAFPWSCIEFGWVVSEEMFCGQLLRDGRIDRRQTKPISIVQLKINVFVEMWYGDYLSIPQIFVQQHLRDLQKNSISSNYCQVNLLNSLKSLVD